MFALRSGATVIPCHISGTRYSDSILRSFFIRHTVRVKYGKPIDLTEFRGHARDKDALTRAADRIMREIRVQKHRGEQARRNVHTPNDCAA